MTLSSSAVVSRSTVTEPGSRHGSRRSRAPGTWLLSRHGVAVHLSAWAARACATRSATAALVSPPPVTIDDRVTVSGTDDDENPVSAQADETVDVTDVKPSIAVVKTADPTSVAETGPGQTRTVTYSVAITNTGTAEAVTLNDLVDQVDGLPAVPVGGTCAALLGTSIDPGDTVNCTFTAQVSGDAGGHVTDTVTATAYDNEENQATAADDDRNLMPNLLACARVHASEGEIVEALQEVFGTYTETPVF